MLLKTGASGRIRTGDLLITNELLYQLSYAGVSGTYHGRLIGQGNLPVKDLHLLRRLDELVSRAC